MAANFVYGEDICGPAPPPKRDEDIIGPVLPPQLRKNAIKKSEDTEIIGPVLPKALSKSSNNSGENPEIIGAVLSKLHSLANKGITQDDKIGDDSDDDFIGPLPPSSSESQQKVSNFDLMPKQPKLPEKLEREEWMLVAPKKLKKQLPLKSVTSFSKAKDTDPKPSSSTDDVVIDPEMREIYEEHLEKRKAEKSLLELHQENRKKTVIINLEVSLFSGLHFKLSAIFYVRMCFQQHFKI